ncbi:MAG: class I SAM-dependent methyltransferase [Geminicoccaceae bacterium]
MGRVIEAPQGVIRISPVAGTMRRIEVTPAEGVHCPRRSCDCDYPDSLIDMIVATKGAAYLCDEILRDVEPLYIARAIEKAVLAYIDPAASKGRRLLDFGAGSGAACSIIGRARPDLQIHGLELRPKSIEIARARAAHYGLKNVTFERSPSGDSLPRDLGRFDYIMMSAVFEHLLPHERDQLLPLLWRHLERGGLFFLNQTPHRWFPIEWHTTGGLPLINYLPDGLAKLAATRLSKKVDKGQDWPGLLRDGIRGSSEGEILRIIRKSGGDAKKTYPDDPSLQDDLSLWRASTSLHGGQRTKKLLYRVCVVLRRLTGLSLQPSLTLALRKV